MLTAQLVGYETLRGRKVSLQRVGVEHAQFLHDCYQNHDFMHLYRLAQNRTETVTQIHARLLENSRHTPEQLRKFEWVVHKNLPDGELGEAIGLAAVADYMKGHRRGEFLIGIVDDAERKRGISLEITLLVLDFAFNHLRLNKLLMLVYEHNVFAHTNAIKFGFKAEGFFAEHVHYPDLGFVGMYQDAFLAKDFYQNKRIQRWSNHFLGRDITAKLVKPQQLSVEEIQQVNQKLQDYLTAST